MRKCISKYVKYQKMFLHLWSKQLGSTLNMYTICGWYLTGAGKIQPKRAPLISRMVTPYSASLSRCTRTMIVPSLQLWPTGRLIGPSFLCISTKIPGIVIESIKMYLSENRFLHRKMDNHMNSGRHKTLADLSVTGSVIWHFYYMF